MITKEKLEKPGLKALNDIYIIEEDSVEFTVDSESGLTPEVIEALKNSKLFIPDKFESFAEKFPCRGTVLACGDKTRYRVPIGAKVIYARLGVMRYKFNGRTLCDVKEADLHAVIT